MEDSSTVKNAPVRIGRRTLLKRTLGTLIGIASGTVGSAIIACENVLSAADKLPERTYSGLAILCSQPDGILDHFGMPFFPVYRATIEKSFGFKAKYVITNATSQNFLEIINDSSIDNLALIGHGNHICWNATDKTMYAEDYACEALKGIQMRGKFLKHTCGELPEPGKYTTYALANRDDVVKRAKDFEKKIGVSCKLTLEKLENEAMPFTSLPVANPEYLNWIIHTSSKRIKRELFGTPLFRDEHVAHWERIASPLDFMIDPYAKGPQEQSYVVRTVQGWLADVNRSTRNS